MSGQDSVPSFTVNLDSGVYLCNACGSKGNIHTYYAETRKLTKQEAWHELGDALSIERPTDIDSRPFIDQGLTAQWHQALMTSTGAIRDILKDKRGIKDDTLKRFLDWLGWRKSHYTNI